jgi:hypothetical protein
MAWFLLVPPGSRTTSSPRGKRASPSDHHHRRAGPCCRPSVSACRRRHRPESGHGWHAQQRQQQPGQLRGGLRRDGFRARRRFVGYAAVQVGRSWRGPRLGHRPVCRVLPDDLLQLRRRPVERPARVPERRHHGLRRRLLSGHQGRPPHAVVLFLQPCGLERHRVHRDAGFLAGWRRHLPHLHLGRQRRRLAAAEQRPRTRQPGPGRPRAGRRRPARSPAVRGFFLGSGGLSAEPGSSSSSGFRPHRWP